MNFCSSLGIDVLILKDQFLFK